MISYSSKRLFGSLLCAAAAALAWPSPASAIEGGATEISEDAGDEERGGEVAPPGTDLEVRDSERSPEDAPNRPRDVEKREPPASTSKAAARDDAKRALLEEPKTEKPNPLLDRRGPDYYDNRAKELLKTDAERGNVDLHPLMEAYPDSYVVVCTAGCPNSDNAKIVSMLPKPKPDPEPVSETPATPDMLSCVAGCGERGPAALAAAKSAPVVETVGEWMTTVAKVPAVAAAPAPKTGGSGDWMSKINEDRAAGTPAAAPAPAAMTAAAKERAPATAEKPATPVAEAKPAASVTPKMVAVAEPKPAAPVIAAEPKPAAPAVAEAKPAAPVIAATEPKPAAPSVAEPKPAAPVIAADPKPAAPPVAEPKPAAPVIAADPKPAAPSVAEPKPAAPVIATEPKPAAPSVAEPKPAAPVIAATEPKPAAPATETKIAALETPKDTAPAPSAAAPRRETETQVAALETPAAGKPAPAVPPKAKNGVISVLSEDKDMNAAIARARGSLGAFWKSLETPAASEADHALKVAIAGNGTTEHFWLTRIKRDNGKLSGVISNQPQSVTTVKMGQRFEFGEEMISDWTFKRNGKLVGNETMRVLLPRMPAEQAAVYRNMYETP